MEFIYDPFRKLFLLQQKDVNCQSFWGSQSEPATRMPKGQKNPGVGRVHACPQFASVLANFNNIMNMYS